MARKILIAVVVVLSVAAFGATNVEAKGRSGGSHRSAPMHQASVKKSQGMKQMPKKTHRHDPKDGQTKWHMGGSSTGPVGTPENPGTKDGGTQWHMGGSSTGPVGTPENPGSKGGQTTWHMGGSLTGPVGTPENPGSIVRDHRGTSLLANAIVRDHRDTTSLLANPIVRDHRDSTLSDIVIRDHR